MQRHREIRIVRAAESRGGMDTRTNLLERRPMEAGGSGRWRWATRGSVEGEARLRRDGEGRKRNGTRSSDIGPQRLMRVRVSVFAVAKREREETVVID
jgi:DNA-binding IclR family transcriptional regulator